MTLVFSGFAAYAGPPPWTLPPGTLLQTYKPRHPTRLTLLPSPYYQASLPSAYSLVATRGSILLRPTWQHWQDYCTPAGKKSLPDPPDLFDIGQRRGNALPRTGNRNARLNETGGHDERHAKPPDCSPLTVEPNRPRVSPNGASNRLLVLALAAGLRKNFPRFP